MCGICGLIGNADPGSAERAVRRMMGQIHHRGPDDEGLFADDSVVLGMRRLSIIDLDGGRQPVFNEDGTVAVVFNGEIYNFQDLRQTLESCGHAFRTASDTEVIVHAYEEWGADCVNRLEGMFAFAVADRGRRGGLGPASACRDKPCSTFAAETEAGRASARPGRPQVLLARDRLGIKPLYYAVAGGKLVFASEVRSLLASGLIQPRLSHAALESYLLFGSVIEPMTLVDCVYSLPPGHRISIPAASRVTNVEPERYWDFAEAAQPAIGSRRLDRESAALFLRWLLEEAVDSHLVADVPVGVFLSSGIDSTALVALAAQKRQRIHTLTVVFEEQEFNEAELARRTAQRFGTEHQEVPLCAGQMLARLDEAVSAFDQPSMDGVNSYFVSWAARQAGLKVALSGLGGDEMFGGYSTFRSTLEARSVAELARRVPAPVRSVMAMAAERFSHLSSRVDAHRKMAALWRDPDFLPHPYFYTRLLFTPVQVLRLLNSNTASPATVFGNRQRVAHQSLSFSDSAACVPGPGERPQSFQKQATLRYSREPWQQWLWRIAADTKPLDDFTAVSSLESQSYMANTLLRDTDAMSMAHSLEVRVPFLDHALVEFVARLPRSVKSANGIPKRLLVEAMGHLLPREVVSQPKRTFTLPWEHWLRGPLRAEVESELSSIAPSLADELDGRAVREVWSSFLDGHTSWSRVWSLFVLSRWAREHLDG